MPASLPVWGIINSSKAGSLDHKLTLAVPTTELEGLLGYALSQAI
jgi:hypothetical protein